MSDEKYPQALVDKHGFWYCQCGWLNGPHDGSVFPLEGDILECDECSEQSLLVKAATLEHP